MVPLVCFITSRSDKFDLLLWFFPPRPVFWLPILLLLLLFRWQTRMSRCWTTSLPCTHRLQRRLLEWHSRAFPCSPEPPRSARKLTRSSKRSSFVPLLFKVSGETLCCGAVVAAGRKREAVICSKLRKCRRPRCACRAELLHQMEVRNEVRHVQMVWFSSRSCWNRWQHLTCPGCSLHLVAQPVFPPQTERTSVPQGAEQPDLSENKKVSCWVLCARSRKPCCSRAVCQQQIVTDCESVRSAQAWLCSSCSCFYLDCARMKGYIWTGNW